MVYVNSHLRLPLRGEDTLSKEDADLLSNARRRGIIRLLGERSTLESISDYILERDRGNPMVRKDISTQLAAWEQGVDIEDVDANLVKSMESTIYQSHIPRLEEEDVIDYDRDEMILRPLDGLGDYFPFVEPEPSTDTPFPGTENYDAEQLTVDQGYSLLSNEKRREVLNYMDDAIGTVTVGELSEHLASIFSDRESFDFDSMDRKAQYVGLVQEHLPRLDALDVVEFDADRKTVEEDVYLDVLSRYVPDENYDYSADALKAFSVSFL